jgi:integrase
MTTITLKHFLGDLRGLIITLICVTLYSFRHSGAIEIFKRTGSLTKLQKAMGHSSLNVSLTYLRGLEIVELKEEDMPIFSNLRS